MGSPARKSPIAQAAALAAALAFGLAACGGGGSGAGAGNPESHLTLAEARAEMPGAPPELAELREQANEILDEGQTGFEERLASLEGTPVVVNKWASWCGPCREEFPYFQEEAIERGDEIAFIGLLSDDGPDTGRTFLEELPLPYPSYLDPNREIADSLQAGREFPSTLFFDSSGEVAFTKLGPYESADDLAADIERYAR